MGIQHWIAKKGPFGGAARLFIKAYFRTRDECPEATDSEIFEAVARWRFDLTGAEVSAKNFQKILHCRTPREFVTRLVMTERWNELKSDPELQELVDQVVCEICEEHDIN